MAALLLFVLGCKRGADPVRAFIPGTYVSAASGEFSVAEDTLVITAGEKEAFTITRHTAYQAILFGKLLPERHLVQHFEGLYDPENRVLNEFTTRRIFRFDPGKRLLLRAGPCIIR